MDRPKVSVIIPVYNVENYIQRCAKSLFEQTIDEIEYLFIDDCSSDRSIEFLKQTALNYPQRTSQIKIIQHPINLGVSQSRQDGVDAASGDYIIHCDPDDWVEFDMYETLYNTAISSNADMVGCDFIVEYPTKSVKFEQDFTLTDENAVYAILLNKLHSSLWCRLIKRNFINNNNLKFQSDISLMEDMLYIIPIHLCTNNIIYVPKALYHYRVNSNGITHTLNVSHIESSVKVLMRLKKYCISNKLEIALKKAIAEKSQAFITQPNIYNPKLWRTLTKNIPLKYFGKIKNRVSPWLVRNNFDKVNLWLIQVYRTLQNR